MLSRSYSNTRWTGWKQTQPAAIRGREVETDDLNTCPGHSTIGLRPQDLTGEHRKRRLRWEKTYKQKAFPLGEMPVGVKKIQTFLYERQVTVKMYSK